jgi:D-alanyl-D-alanine carboxypeptidase (penicillin-binding protein 5/6)
VSDDGRVLWSREPSRRRAMASITKIMTALVVLDRLKLTDKVTIVPQAAAVGESEAQLNAGDVLTVKDALSATLVKSANDAALALAIRAAGSEKKFVALMNAKARELGMAGTHFANAHGLDEPGHYSTAEDIAVMSRVAMTKPVFRDIVRRRSVRIGRGSAARALDSSNLLLGTYPGANGVKTGWTNDAGHSVVASARRGGVSLVAVVLGADSDTARFEEAARLLDWGFEHYRPVRASVAGSVAGTVAVSDYIDREALALVARDQTATVFDLDGAVTSRTVLPDEVQAPVTRGATLGALRVTQGSRLLANVPLVADRNVAAPRFLERVGIAVRRLWLRLFG